MTHPQNPFVSPSQGWQTVNSHDFGLFSRWEGRYRWPANSPDGLATWHLAFFFKRGKN